jgi:hypothetical protein
MDYPNLARWIQVIGANKLALKHAPTRCAIDRFRRLDLKPDPASVLPTLLTARVVLEASRC